MMKTTTNEVVVEAVILKTTAYKDNDMILHVYTREYGKLGIHARGVRKMTSKNARACQSMMISEMTIFLKKGLSSLVKATPVHYLHHIKENLESEIVANYVLEYYYRYIEENQPDVSEYEVLNDALQALELGYLPLYVYLLFQVFILKQNGVSLGVDGCVVCQSPQVTTISLNDGGFLCHEHQGRHQTYDIALLKAFRHIHKISFKQIEHLHIDPPILKQLIPIMNAFLEEYTGITLKTSIFIRQIV